MITGLQQLMDSTGISLFPVGVYDLADPSPFAPFARPSECIFSHFQGWQEGQSTLVSRENAGQFACPGAAYWMCGISQMPREAVASYLASQGLKASTEIMGRWLDTHPPHAMANSVIVISRLRKEGYKDLKTVTFFVNPDQLSALLTGAEYSHSAPGRDIAAAPYGSGCGQLLASFRDLDRPSALIGATDIAARPHLPPHIMAFTVTKPLFEQLCRLDQNSFLHKPYWERLRASRAVPCS